ncbi:MAG: hypothetical protein IKV27_08205 [Lachnospiraceae bacterium]|nr:hypothetical protein [Lachnospiraceae bacterium]
MKRKKILGVTIAAGFLVIAVAAVCFARAKQPQWRLTKGMVNLGAELSRYYNPVLAEAELDKLIQKLQNGATHTVAEVDVSLPGKEVSTLGLKLDKSTDRQKRLLKAVGEISMFGKDGLDLEVAMEGEELYLKLPSLTSKALKLDADRLVSGFNDSFLAKLVGWNIPKDYESAGDSDTVRGLLAGAFVAGSIGQRGADLMTEAEVRDFLAQVEIIDSDKEFTIENSFREIQWTGYTLKLPGEAVNQLFIKLGQILDSDKTVRFKEQLLLDIYLDEDDRIVRISTPEALTDLESGVKIEFTLDLLGEERTVDVVTITMYVTDETQTTDPKEAEVTLHWKGMPEAGGTSGQSGSSGSLALEWKPVRDDAAWPETGNLSVTYDWDYTGKAFMVTGEKQTQGNKLACEMKGNLLDVVPGERVQLNVERLRVIRGEKEFFHVTGLLMLEPLMEEIVMPRESVSVGW